MRSSMVKAPRVQHMSRAPSVTMGPYSYVFICCSYLITQDKNFAVREGDLNSCPARAATSTRGRNPHEINDSRGGIHVRVPPLTCENVLGTPSFAHELPSTSLPVAGGRHPEMLVRQAGRARWMLSMAASGPVISATSVSSTR